MNPPMGLNKSKNASAHVSKVSKSSDPKSKSRSQDKSPERTVERQSTSSRPSSISSASSSHSPLKTTMKSQRNITEAELASNSKNIDVKKKSFLVPQIIVTRASNERLRSITPEQEVQRTIRDQIDYGPYYRHRNPSTIDAYRDPQNSSTPKPKTVL